jgi:hypothetical protein
MERTRSGVALLAAVLAIAATLQTPGVRRKAETAARRAQAAAQSLDAEALAAVPSKSAAAAGFDSERVWGAWNDWEPAVAADPVSPFVYQMTTRYNGPAPCKGCKGPWIVFRRSEDGGATWGPDKYVTARKGAFNDPEIEVASDGTLYAAYLDGYNPGVSFIKSTDRGETWSAPQALTQGAAPPAWSDKPILAVSADGRDVYVGLNASDSYVVASHNGGTTWSHPVKTNSDARYWFHTGGTVAPDGTVYFGAVDYSQTYEGDSHVNVLRSSDGGQSWTTTRVDSSAQMPGCAWAAGCYLGFLGPSAAVAVDAAGRVMLAYHAGASAGAAQRMYVRTSADGVSWGARVEVGATTTGVNHAFPALAAGPTPGDFRLAFQDDRNGSRTAWNTWYRRTTNGGGSWSAAARLSDKGSGASYKAAAGYRFPYGDYFEIAVDADGQAHAIWGEGQSYDGPGGSWYTRGN